MGMEFRHEVPNVPLKQMCDSDKIMANSCLRSARRPVNRCRRPRADRGTLLIALPLGLSEFQPLLFARAVLLLRRHRELVHTAAYKYPNGETMEGMAKFGLLAPARIRHDLNLALNEIDPRAVPDINGVEYLNAGSPSVGTAPRLYPHPKLAAQQMGQTWSTRRDLALSYAAASAGFNEDDGWGGVGGVARMASHMMPSGWVCASAAAPPLGSMDSLVMVPPRWSARSARACARPPRYLILKPIFFSPSSLLFSGQAGGVDVARGEGNRAWARRRRRVMRANGSSRETQREKQEQEQEWDRQSPRPLRNDTTSSPRPRTCTYAARRRPPRANRLRLHPGSRAPLNSTPALTGSAFALPYRMLYPVVTIDAVAIYDTQQAGPFMDLTWSPDGQCLMLSSCDGYCMLVTFARSSHAPPAPQLQQIAAQHSVPILYTSSSHSHTSDSESQAGGPLEPLTPAASVDGTGSGTLS
ncbi:hypothetical protein B0H16DRAFT_1703553 [Mycena metata]|uniref:Uncharacterized protein n=1 Tax=Mycena metata TaxID=1033252 RepID=A0AAD7H3T2_9AGAR|nr:hypothetical protein B0H16DRAFT_1703553 [Mycena metata]